MAPRRRAGKHEVHCPRRVASASLAMDEARPWSKILSDVERAAARAPTAMRLTESTDTSPESLICPPLVENKASILTATAITGR